MAGPDAYSLTETFRKQQLALRAATMREVLGLWPALDYTELDATFKPVVQSIGRIVYDKRRVSSTLAGRYVKEVRRAEGVTGDVEVVLATPPPAEEIVEITRSTSVISVKRASALGVPESKAMQNALVQTTGAVSRWVLDGARETVQGTVRGDRKAYGWRRVTSGTGCGFCRMLADKGAVYKEATVRFGSHAHCACSAMPVYAGPAIEVPTTAVDEYTPSATARTPAERARTRRWMKRNGYL